MCFTEANWFFFEVICIADKNIDYPSPASFSFQGQLPLL